MIGLEYILQLYNVQHKDLAEEFGIKKQNINLWIKGKKKIPAKYLPVLAEKYNLPIEYFQKELSNLDKKQIDFLYAEIELEKTTIEYERVFFDEETGQRFEYTETCVDSGAVGEYRLKEADLEEAKVLSRINEIIYDMPEPDSIDMFVESHKSNLEFFKKYIEVIERTNNREDILEVITALGMFNKMDEKMKQELVYRAEKYMSETMKSEMTVVEALCAVMLLYKKDKK